jgi:ferrous iron transport protein B
MIGKFMEPLLKPLGFDWRVGVSLIPGFVAKEVVVGSFAVLYMGDNEGENSGKLSEAIKKSGSFTPLSAISFMVFSLIYVPCLATVSVIRKEAGNSFWGYFAIFYSLILAWILSFIIYQGGHLLGFQ